MRATNRRRLETILRFVGVGVVAGALVGVLIRMIDGGPLLPHVARGVLSGAFMAGGVATGEEALFFGRRRWRGYRRVTAARIGGYGGWVLFVLICVNTAWSAGDRSLGATALGYVRGATFGRDALFALIVGAVATAYLEVRRLHNPGEIRRFLLGRYRVPVEEERVFLFADLIGSTALAEELGARAYSRLISDCFRDLSEAVLAWRGEVYQYVGDEIVVSWPLRRRSDAAAAIRCFLDMQADLDARADHYRAGYGHVPRFRGAVHAGSVVTSWVGFAKMELAFHGDALNTAARILGACKELGGPLLVSTNTLAEIQLPEEMEALPIGPTQLRGLREDVDVSIVRGRDSDPPAVEPPVR